MENFNGFYKVGEKNFSSKILASIESEKSGQALKWFFFDHVWEKQSEEKKNFLDSNLSGLYEQRAKQLRNKYDYLILNYSGGVDSWNVLYTFLKNNIRLDEIFVKWSPGLDEKLFKPSLNTNSKNFLSEWFYVIHPDLKWLQQSWPSIKIVVEDPFKAVGEKFYTHDLFVNTNQYYGVFELMRQNCFSSTVNTNSNLNIGEIWGIDKPSFHFEGDDCRLFFVDSTINVSHNSKQLSSQEFFYYSIDFPELLFAQVQHAVLALNNELNHIKINFTLEHLKTLSSEEWNRVWLKSKDLLAKEVWYKEAVSFRPRKFQADKPTSFSSTSRSRDYVYDTNPHSEYFKNLWNKPWSEFSESLGNPDKIDFLKSVKSKKHFVCRSDLGLLKE